MELELWKRIAACEVPGLTVMCSQFEVCVHHDNGKHDWAQEVVYYDGKPSKSRAAAMLVVDALEAAGWAYGRQLTLEYYPGGGSEGRELEELTVMHEVTRLINYRYFNSYASDHGGKEHLALLSLLAEVVEAI